MVLLTCSKKNTEPCLDFVFGINLPNMHLQSFLFISLTLLVVKLGMLITCTVLQYIKGRPVIVYALENGV